MVTLSTRIQEKKLQAQQLLSRNQAKFADISLLLVCRFLLLEPIELISLGNIQKCKQMLFQMSIYFC